MKPLVLLPFLLIFSASAKSQKETSVFQYCKDKGYKVGTLDFESCCDRRQETENNKENSRKPTILGRDMGGRFDKSRIKEEALDLAPREPSDLQGLSPLQN